MNPYFCPRGGERRLAGLSALWLDLEHLPRSKLGDAPAARSARAHPVGSLGGRIASPSMLIDSGRGHYCVWLINGTSPSALPRWRAVMRALTAWAKPFGADPAWVDPARVLRLPCSWHEGAGRQVTVVGGDGARHPFELLPDSIWRAVGRPTRRELDTVRHKPRKEAGTIDSAVRPRGLPRRAF